VSAGKVGGAARIVLGLLYPRRLQKTYHAARGGCRNRARQVRSWSFEEAGLDLGTGGRSVTIGTFSHTYASVVGVSVDPSVVGRDWSPVSSNKARGYCCRTPGGHRAPLQPGRWIGVQPGGICVAIARAWYGASRSPGVRGRACAQCKWFILVTVASSPAPNVVDSALHGAMACGLRSGCASTAPCDICPFCL
jgi:hypothetical protein